MPLQAQQIVNLALQKSKTGDKDATGVSYGYTKQAGEFLNMILSGLARTYDLEVLQSVTTFMLDGGIGAGPYPLPTDYLRAMPQDAFYVISGTPYAVTYATQSEYDAFVQMPSLSNYPTRYTTDISGGPTDSSLYVWPPAGGSYPLTIRYYKQPADITSPETSSVIPWFPFESYLVERLTGELMQLGGDPFWRDILTPDTGTADRLLSKFLKKQTDSLSIANTIQLDPRYWGPRNVDSLPVMKKIGF